MQRIQSFDLARGFTVLLMPSIHVVMLYSQPAIQQSLLGDILGFIAEGPGAQLFMFLMGVSLTLSIKINKRYVITRSAHLLLAAYALNFMKFLVPLGLGFMPDNLMAELNLDCDLRAVIFFLLIGDILHFAAIAYIILYTVSKLRHSPYWALLIAGAVICVSPLLWDLQFGINPLDHIIALFNGHPPQVFFPIFPWIVYPLMGLVFGHLLKQINLNYLLRKTGLVGVGLIIASLCLPPTTETDPWLPFYRTRPADTIFHLGFVLTWLSIFHWISRKIPSNPFFTLLTFCSRNITSIYLIQWILICWCLAFTGYLQLGLFRSFMWMMTITLITLLLTWRIQKTHAPRKSI